MCRAGRFDSSNCRAEKDMKMETVILMEEGEVICGL